MKLKKGEKGKWCPHNPDDWAMTPVENRMAADGQTTLSLSWNLELRSKNLSGYSVSEVML